MIENGVDGSCGALSLVKCFRAMKILQNRGEGFDVGEQRGGRFELNDAADQASELANRRHMRRDVVDDEILNFFRSKERKTRFINTETEEKLHNRIGGFCVGDEILLGDEEISNLFGVVFFVSWERIKKDLS